MAQEFKVVNLDNETLSVHETWDDANFASKSLYGVTKVVMNEEAYQQFLDDKQASLMSKIMDNIDVFKRLANK